MGTPASRADGTAMKHENAALGNSSHRPHNLGPLGTWGAVLDSWVHRPGGTRDAVWENSIHEADTWRRRPTQLGAQPARAAGTALTAGDAFL
ncbi:hypothetical protein N9L68_00365 [bacterium]|nr:hypothetical protein [bacterium]